jgi:hypothetical protein
MGTADHRTEAIGMVLALLVDGPSRKATAQAQVYNCFRNSRKLHGTSRKIPVPLPTPHTFGFA